MLLASTSRTKPKEEKVVIHMISGIQADDRRVVGICEKAKGYGLRPEVHTAHGTRYGVVEIYLKDAKHTAGSTPEHPFANMPGVEKIVRVSPSSVSLYMNGNHDPHRIAIGTDIVGQGLPCLPVFGQCTIDRQINKTVEGLARLGILHQRGCPDKPRSRPGSFYGHGERGLHWFVEAAAANGLQSIWLEVMDTANIEAVRRVRDQHKFDGSIVLWVGARTSNQILLQTLGRQKEFVVMLKHRLNTPDVDEFMTMAGYILEGPVGWHENGAVDHAISSQAGNDQLIFCVRGLEKQDKHLPLRFYPNLDWIDVLHQKSWAAVCFDPSHVAGDLKYVFPMIQAGLEHKPDVLMVEVHPDPATALCDKEQAVPLDKVPEMVAMIKEHNNRCFPQIVAA